MCGSDLVGIFSFFFWRNFFSFFLGGGLWCASALEKKNFFENIFFVVVGRRLPLARMRARDFLRL